MKSFIKTIILEEKKEGFSVNENKVFGLLKTESENGNSFLSLTMINLAVRNDGDYFFAVITGGHTFAVKIEKTKLSAELSVPFVLDDNAVFFLIYKKGEDITAVCGGGLKSTDSEQENIKRIKDFLDGLYEKTDDTEKETEKEFVFNEQEKNIYDDEKLADENYYLNSEEIKENELPLYPSAFSADNQSQEEKEPEKKEDKTFGDEKNSGLSDEKRPFYLTVKEELDKLFSTYQREDALKASIPSGDFIKVTFGENEYYVVGVIREKNIPKYICYGIPSVYSSTPPEALKGISSFIPISVFDLKGDGYFMIFQDAITGECKKTAK